MTTTAPTSVHLVRLGCARNDVDSEELAARLAAGGFEVVDDPLDADVLVVNTCGFIEQAKKDSIDTLLDAADLKAAGGTQAVVAVGCLAQRYGQELAEALPEADAVLGFDAYPDIADRLRRIMDGEQPISHVPSDRRTLLPIAPIERPSHRISVPGHGGELAAGVGPASGPVPRKRLTNAPWAPLKIASGCDRRCAFCAIPSFRGSFLSRPPAEIVAEARWLVGQGVREVLLVSENSSSYGKDLGELHALEALFGDLARVDGLDWIRISYLQPAEVRASLVDLMCASPKVLPYFDLSFQHASGPLLRRMRRFGDADSFLNLIESIRSKAPQAGIRSNVIVGFPGETDIDVSLVKDFLVEARLDVVGVFGYSDEEGTEAATLSGKLDSETIQARVDELTDLSTQLCDERAEERIGESTWVLIESLDAVGASGRAIHQGPDVDGTALVRADGLARPEAEHALQVGDIVPVDVTDSDGVDLVATWRSEL